MRIFSIKWLLSPFIANILLVGLLFPPTLRAESLSPAFSFRVSLTDKGVVIYLKNTGKVTVEQAGLVLEFDGRSYYSALGAPIAAGQEKTVTAMATLPNQAGTYPAHLKLHYSLKGQRYSIVHVAPVDITNAAPLDTSCTIENITFEDSASIFLKRSSTYSQRLFLPDEVKIASTIDTPAGVQYDLERNREALQSSYQVFEIITSNGDDQSPLYRTRICSATITVTRRGPPTGYLPAILLGLLGAGALLLVFAWFRSARFKEKLREGVVRSRRIFRLSYLLKTTEPSTALSRVRALSCIFFFTSGAAALIYEVIWVRILGLIFGNTTYAVTTVLATYMAGLGLGSYLFGRAVDRWTRPLRAYGLLEVCLGLYAAFTFVFVSIIEASFVFLAQHVSGQSAFLVTVRFFLSAFILLAPTLLMGGTLPILIRFYIGTSSAVGSGTGLLYGLNTAGAVLGTFLAGFFFIPILGLTETLALAVFINVTVGILAYLCSGLLRRLSIDERSDSKPTEGNGRPVSDSPQPVFSVGWLPFGLFISGVLAMVYEVAWTRVFALLVGSSTYAFSLMLTTFLLGLALGSYLYRKRLVARAPSALEWALLVLVTSLFCMATLPYYQYINIWSVRIFALTARDYTWFSFAQFILLSLFMIIPALCFGAIFPLSVALYSKNNTSVGREIGSLYLANTLGNITGSLLAGFLLISLFGIYHTFMVAIIVGGILALGIIIWFRKQSRAQFAALLVLSGILVTLCYTGRHGWLPNLMSTSLIVHPEKFIVHKTNDILSALFEHNVLFYREGLQSIVSVNETATGRYLNVNGKTDASTNIKGDMTTQLLMGHLPHLLHLNARTSLVIGFGSGTTLASVLAHPVNDVELVEIEQAVRDAAPLLASVNRRAYLDRRAKIIINDARNHLLVTRKRYDVIASEPSNPWMAGVGNLYTQEFYRLVKGRLAKDGLFCQWLQKYNLSPKDFQMVVATVRSVFPFVTIWRASSGDVLLIATEKEARLDLSAAEGRYQRPLVKRDLEQIGIFGLSGLLAYFVLGNDDVSNFVENARINTDNLPILEFEAPKALHYNAADVIEKIAAAYRNKDARAALVDGDAIAKNPDAIAYIGLAFIGMNDFNKAGGYFNTVLKFDEKNAKGLLGIGLIKVQNKDFQDANRFFAQALGSDPASPLVKRLVGIALADTENKREALAMLDAVSSVYNADWEVVKARVSVLVGIGRMKEALPLCRYLVQLQPLDLEIAAFCARIVERVEGADASIEILNKIRTQHPAFSTAYKELKRLYDSMGKLEPSIEIYESLVKANPYNTQYWTVLIELYRAVGDEDKAAYAIDRAAKLEPNFEDLLEFGVL